MINLNVTDTIEGLASVTNVVEFTFSGVDGTTTISKEGKLTDAQTTIHTATGIVRAYGLTLYNSHSSAVTITISKDPADAGTLYRIFSISLGVGYTALFDGARLSVFDALGGLVTGVNVSDIAFAASWDGVTTIAPSKNAVYDQIELRALKASPIFTGQATIPTINLTGGQIAFPATAVPSAGSNTLDDYEEGLWTPGITFGGGIVGMGNSANNGGYYTKIGNVVTVSGLMQLTAKGSSTGTVNFTGLPFSVADSYSALASVSMSFSKVAFANAWKAEITKNATIFGLQQITEAGVVTDLDNTDFSDDSYIVINLTYRTV